MVRRFSNDYTENAHCVLCEVRLIGTPRRNPEYDFWDTHCPNCGKYRIARAEYRDLIDHWRIQKPDYLPMISHKIRLRQRPDEMPVVSAPFLIEIFDGELGFPNAIEQVENLVIYLAENLRPGDQVNITRKHFQAVVGATGPVGFGWVVKSTNDIGWIQGGSYSEADDLYGLTDGSLTIDGWKWYNEIGRHKHSTIAFMAMPYGKEPLTSIVDDHFRPAVKQTGFDLVRLDDQPKAGIIDNRLRVEIRRSRFLISDITHDNHGAIWEAGFAEGLGRPVIYTCEASKLKEKHFDIRNCQMVPWEEKKPEDAAEMLKATIRNTLPDDAILEDPE